MGRLRSRLGGRSSKATGMLIAATTTKKGRKLLIIGLQAGNVKRLLNDEPIYKDLSVEPQNVPGLEEWDNDSRSRGHRALRRADAARPH